MNRREEIEYGYDNILYLPEIGGRLLATALLVICITLAAVGFGLALFFTITYFLRTISGWSTMAGYYAYQGPAPHNVLNRQTMMVGKVQYRNCMRFAVLPGGMYLQSCFNPQALLIPWGAFAGCRETSLYWQKAVLLTIGDPVIGTITLFKAHFEMCRKYLSHLPS
jgi:hypothetical protein